VLSTLHQSSLGSLYLIVPGKLHPLWYSPMLPVLFWLSAVSIGLAMTIFESTMSARHFPGHELEKPVVTGLGRVLLVMLIVYGLVRVQNLLGRHALQYALQPTYEAGMFWAEVMLAFLLPIALLLLPRVRENPVRLYFVSILVISGFVMNRLNVAATGMEGFSGERYIPRLTEVSITLSIVAVGIFIFTMAVKYLPIFTHGHDKPAPLVKPKQQQTAPPTAIPAPAR
jgi:Ni/Fe-hydrogenase subunit HybB-like protein